jgi:hypothetical protein
MSETETQTETQIETETETQTETEAEQEAEKRPDDKKLPTRKVALRYGVSVRSVERWEADKNLGFPKPIYIHRRKYWAEAELTAWERRPVRRIAPPPPKRSAATPKT